MAIVVGLTGRHLDVAYDLSEHDVFAAAAVGALAAGSVPAPAPPEVLAGVPVALKVGSKVEIYGMLGGHREEGRDHTIHRCQ